MDKRKLTEEASAEIWNWIWDNADASDSDEDLFKEYDDLSKAYKNYKNLPF